VVGFADCNSGFAAIIVPKTWGTVSKWFPHTPHRRDKGPLANPLPTPPDTAAKPPSTAEG